MRKTVGSLMSTLIVRGGYFIWPEVIEFLNQNLTSQDASVVENSIQSLSIIIEDSQGLDEENFLKALERLIPNIINLVNPVLSEGIKQHAINCLNLIMSSGVTSFYEHIDAYVKHLVSMSGDPSTLVLLRIVQGLLTVADRNVDLIL